MIQPLKSAKNFWILHWLDVQEPTPSASGYFLPTLVFVTDPRGRPLSPPTILEELDQARVESLLIRLFETHGAPERLLITPSEDWNEEDWRAFAREQNLEIRIQSPGSAGLGELSAEVALRVVGGPESHSEPPFRIAESLVRTSLQLRSPSKKSALLAKALALDPDCTAARIEAADLEFQRGNWKNCLAAYDEIIARESHRWRKEKPQWWEDRRTRPYLRALFGRAMTLWHRGRYLEAASQLEKLVSLNPRDNQGARFMIPLLYLLAEDYSTGAAAFAAYEKNYPNDLAEPSLLFGWGLSLGFSGDEAGARAKYHSAILRNIYIAPLLLEEPLPPQNIYFPMDRADFQYASGFMDSYAVLWDRESGSTRLLREAWQAATPGVEALIRHREAMLDFQDQRYDPDFKTKWQQMLEEDDRLSSANSG